jgi:hypothetical protein
MFRDIPHLRSVCLPATALAIALFSARDVNAAGLIAYRNDTNQVVVVQSSVTINGIVRKDKPRMLSPGEVAVDGLVFVGTRKITVYDPKKPKTPLFEDDAIIKDDTLLSIQPDMPATPVKKPPPPVTKVRLVASKLPTLPNGPLMPGTPGSPTSPTPPAGRPKKP